MLGAFYPFMRNVRFHVIPRLRERSLNVVYQHNADTSISQEFYRWASVTQAAKNVLDIRLVILFRYHNRCLTQRH